MLVATHDDVRDTGARNGATERLCVVSRAVKPVADMIRFVVGPDGTVVPDVKRRLPGRGIWITATRAALNEAIARKAFARGFKRDVRATPDLAELTERVIERAALDALAVARKAGKVASGFARTRTALAREPVVAVLRAADAAADGVRKITAALQRRDDAAEVRVITGFSSAQLDLALGRPNVIHAALLAGPESQAFLVRVNALERFRGEQASVEMFENRDWNG